MNFCRYLLLSTLVPYDDDYVLGASPPSDINTLVPTWI